MCYSVGCSKCGKTSWAGCGKHVPGVYDTIADKEKDLCLCKSWPGVELPPDLAAKVPQQTPLRLKLHVRHEGARSVKGYGEADCFKIGLSHVIVMGCEATGHSSFVEEGNVVENILMTGQSC